jgi:hypothetical protein
MPFQLIRRVQVYMNCLCIFGIIIFTNIHFMWVFQQSVCLIHFKLFSFITPLYTIYTLNHPLTDLKKIKIGEKEVVITPLWL